MSEFTKPAEELFRDSREYVDAKIDDVKLRTVRGLSLSISKVLAMILILGVATSFLLVLSLGLILLLGQIIGGNYAAAALITAGVLAILLVVLFLLRDKLFSGTFIPLLMKLFFDKDGNDGKEEL